MSGGWSGTGCATSRIRRPAAACRGATRRGVDHRGGARAADHRRRALGPREGAAGRARRQPTGSEDQGERLLGASPPRAPADRPGAMRPVWRHFIAAGRDYLACANARKFDRCEQRKAIRRPVLEEFVLDLIRDRMMQPDAVKAFVEAYTDEINVGRDSLEVERRRQQKELGGRHAKLDGLYDAIADGLVAPGCRRSSTAGGREAQARTALAEPAPTPVRLHPNLARALPREGRRPAASPCRAQHPGRRPSRSCAASSRALCAHGRKAGRSR